MLYVTTLNARYVVDRESNYWMRESDSNPKYNDGEWISGGFTLGEVGEGCFAHYDKDPRGALGRWTSRVVYVEEG